MNGTLYLGLSMKNEEIRLENKKKTIDAALRCFMKYGIENVSQNLLSKETGLSLRSINRFFAGKDDLIIHAIDQLAQEMSANCALAQEYIQKKNKTGIEMLEAYLLGLRTYFLREPLRFAFKREVDVYLYRNSTNRGDIYHKLALNTCPRPILYKIIDAGKKDGSIVLMSDIDTEVNYLSSTYFNFLADIAVKKVYCNEPDDAQRQIDDFIKKALKMYQTE